MSTRPTASKPAVVLPKRTPVLLQPKEEEGGLFSTNRILGIAIIVVYTSAVFIVGYLTGYSNYPSDAAFLDPSKREAGEAQIGSEASAQPGSETAISAGHQCPPCAQRVNIDTSVFGMDDEILLMSEKAFACNAQKAMEDLTGLHQGTQKVEAQHNKNRQDRDRYASFGLKLMKAQEEEKAFRFCVQTMMPDLLRYWDQKAKEGKLPTWSEANERGGKGRSETGGITNAVLMQTAMELDPSAQREAEQANKMQSGLKTVMEKMALGHGGKLTGAQLAQLKALHEQLGSHLSGDQ
eukprot:CAMPEP_0197592190 /NCGR_PEP_ID=MMETSP1326-20131121/14903_1 /TAXON_ID=1155430 /ORGANISM="Genus nov. species nov., Strain RCC2288" /LENGTH=293 /DNA_ID=CAMNT_0043157861 /DNA_START=13 /DNA_END=894 /DNA_ORIENTATION=+